MDRELLKAQLKRHEGLRLFPYLDSVDKLTIGYGRNLDDVGISQPEAEALLDADIDKAERQMMTVEEYRGLDPVRQAVMVNMCFNLGFAGLMGFRKTWLAIERKDYVEAARQMLDSRWARQVGRRAIELADIMQSGEVKR